MHEMVPPPAPGDGLERGGFGAAAWEYDGAARDTWPGATASPFAAPFSGGSDGGDAALFVEDGAASYLRESAAAAALQRLVGFDDAPFCDGFSLGADPYNCAPRFHEHPRAQHVHQYQPQHQHAPPSLAGLSSRLALSSHQAAAAAAAAAAGPRAAPRPRQPPSQQQQQQSRRFGTGSLRAYDLFR